MTVATDHLFTDALSVAELMGAGAAVRTLDLLRDIDATILGVSHHAALLRTVEEAFKGVMGSINEGSMSGQIPEENVVPMLERLQESLVGSYPVFHEKMLCAVRDPRLHIDDGVTDAYKDLLEAIHSLNETAEKLRWSILESNADAEPEHVPVVLRDTDAINAYLDDL